MAGRPKADIDDNKLRQFMRLKPSLADCAAFFECHEDTIRQYIKREYKTDFPTFRGQNMVHTRYMLIRTAIKKAEKGDNVMLIFCLKNLCGWTDKHPPTAEEVKAIKLAYADEPKKK